MSTVAVKLIVSWKWFQRLWEIDYPSKTIQATNWLSKRLILNYDLLCSSSSSSYFKAVNREKSSGHVAMVAKCLDPNKLWSCKYGRQKLTCLTFMYMIALRNKTVAHAFLPSLDNAEWPSLSRKVAEIQKCCHQGNLTSYFSSRLCITLLLITLFIQNISLIYKSREKG